MGFRDRLAALRHDEGGFTLIELLVVILILGILSTISLSVFTTQRNKAFDSSAISDIAIATRSVENCFVETSNYGNCNATAAAPPTGPMAADNTKLSYGGNPGQIEVYTIYNVTGAYTIVALSKSGTTFYVQRTVWGVLLRYCNKSGGMCKADGSW